MYFFNSHPHKEDDEERSEVYENGTGFSTHILTRRMTIFALNEKVTACFSTHILTRRMTHDSFVTCLKNRFSTHILTRRMTVDATVRDIREAFQLTSSQGG